MAGRTKFKTYLRLLVSCNALVPTESIALFRSVVTRCTMASVVRPLRFWEQIGASMNISFAFDLAGPVTPLLVEEAWKAVRAEHNYLDYTIAPDAAGLLTLRPSTASHVCFELKGLRHLLANTPKCIVAQAKCEHKRDANLAGWNVELIKFANTLRNHAICLAYFKLLSRCS